MLQPPKCTLCEAQEGPLDSRVFIPTPMIQGRSLHIDGDCSSKHSPEWCAQFKGSVKNFGGTGRNFSMMVPVLFEEAYVLYVCLQMRRESALPYTDRGTPRSGPLYHNRSNSAVGPISF